MINNVLSGVRSISLVEDPVFGTGEKVLLIDWSSQWSDTVTFYNSPKQLSNKVDAEVLDPLEITIRSKNNYLRYSNNFLKQMNYVVLQEGLKFSGWKEDDITKWVNNNCIDLDGNGDKNYIQFKNTFGRITKLYCMGNGGYAGDINIITTPKTIWDVDFTISNSKEEKELNLSNENNVEGGLVSRLDNDVYIRWEGSFIKQIPSIATQIYGSKSRFGSWNLVDEIEVNKLLNYYRLDGITLVREWVDGSRTREDTENLIANQISVILNKWTWNPDFSDRDKISFESNVMRYDLDETIFIPNFAMYVNREFIRIKLPTTDPEIGEIKIKDIEADKEAKIRVEIRNKESGERGTIQVKLICEPPLTVFSDIQLVEDIRPGDSEIVEFRVIGSIEDKTKGSCIFEATDSKDTSRKVTKKFSYVLVPRKKCEDGEQVPRLEGSVWIIYECRNNNPYARIVKVCQPGEFPKSNIEGKYKCIKDGGSNGDCKWWNVFCKANRYFNNLLEELKNKLGKYFKPLQLGLAIIISLLGTLFTYDNLIKKFTREEQKIPVIFISLVTGGIMGILVFKYFWGGIMIFIGYLALSVIWNLVSPNFGLTKVRI